MRVLNIDDLEMVTGGEGETKSESVKENAQTAVDVCGKGNVKSVSVDGFECK